MYAESTSSSVEGSSAAHSVLELDTDALSGILSTITIPPCPIVVTTLLAESREDEVDFPRIIRLISGDVSLAASMIKTANSPFFALRSKVQGVQQAVAVLGLKNILQVVSGLELQRALSKGISMDRFWERSNLHAVVCACLGRRLPGIRAEDAYTYGLFHDCGIPILMQRFPDYKDTLAQANRSPRPMPELEFERHATSHVVVGAMLARNWQLPEKIVRAIKGHHDPILLDDNREPEDVRTLIAISLLGDHLVTRYLGMSDEAEWQTWGEKTLNYLGFDPMELEELYPEVAEDLAETRSARG